MAPEVIQTMMDQMEHDFGNASSTHWFGRTAHTVMDKSRKILADAIHAQPGNMVITSGATESNNTAITQTAHTRASLGSTSLQRLLSIPPFCSR